MDYTEQMGLGKGFAKQAEKVHLKMLLARDGPPSYNSDIPLRNYFHFLDAYSMDRLDWEREEAIKGRCGSPGWTCRYKLERMLTTMLVPIQSIETIRNRQAVLRNYVGSPVGEKEGDLVWLTRELLENHYSLYCRVSELGSREVSLTNVAGPFSRAVNGMTKFRDRFQSDPVMGGFATRIDELFKDNPVAGMASILENGGVLVVSGTNPTAVLRDRHKYEHRERNPNRERGMRRFNINYGRELAGADERDPDGSLFWLAKSGPKGDGVFLLNGPFRKGDDAKLETYPNQRRDVAAMLDFALDSSVLVYTLGTFCYQADVYHRLRKLGLPACVPEVNDDGRFRVKRGYPVATKVVDKPVFMDMSYDRNHRKHILGGAHSGGKSEYILNVGTYHLLGLGGGIWPAEEGEVPLTTRVITSVRKVNESGKGSLESEVKAAMKLDKEMGAKDLVLIDEFLDTTKPELARHISLPLLKGEAGLCRGFANSPGTVYIVDHRAPMMSDDLGFEFLYPVLKKVDAKKYVQELRNRSDRIESIEGAVIPGKSRKTILMPTHTFAVGRPNVHEVREHALQMWESVLAKAKNPDEFSRVRREFEDYGLLADNRDSPVGSRIVWQVMGESEGVWLNDPRQIADYREQEAQELDEMREDEKEKEPESYWDDDRVVFDVGNLGAPDEDEFERLGRLVDGEREDERPLF